MNKFCKLCVNLQQVLEQVLDKFYKFWALAKDWPSGASLKEIGQREQTFDP